MSIGELAIRLEKRWVTRDSLLQQISRREQSRFRSTAKAGQKKIVGASVKIEGRDVVRWGLLNRILFTWRKPSLQLASNRHRDLTLNRKYIGKVAVISLRPELPVGSRIDQLRIDTYAIGSALNASFQYMRHAECRTNFAQVAWSAGLILHCRCAADDFQVGDPGKAGQNFILDAICEIGVLFFLA